MNIKLDNTSFAFQMGLEIEKMEKGHSRGVLHVDGRHRNSVGLVHGGVLCTMADTICATAILSGIDENRHPLTVDLNISFLKPARGKRITADASIVHLGYRIARVECSLMSDDILVARVGATFMIVERKEIKANDH